MSQHKGGHQNVGHSRKTEDATKGREAAPCDAAEPGVRGQWGRRGSTGRKVREGWFVVPCLRCLKILGDPDS